MEHEEPRVSVASAVSEVLAGHGLARNRQRSPVAVQANPPPPKVPVFHYSATSAVPFVSPRHQPPPHATNNVVSKTSGAASPPRHTAVTINDDSTPPVVVAGSPSPLRSRDPPLQVDTTSTPHSHEAQNSSPNPTGRRRTPSAAGASRGLRSPPKRPTQSPVASSPLPPPAAVLSASFMRRKPMPRPPTPPHEVESHQPPVYFFQDADTDTPTEHPAPGDRTSDVPTDNSNNSTLEDDSFADHENKASSSPRRPHATGIEKLGELSREEDAYDFAILLKPSKTEEHIHVQDDVENENVDGASHVRSRATSGEDNAFRLPGRRHQQHDRAVLVQRITRTGLQVKRLLSLDGRQTLLKVRAPPPILELGAERLRLRKRRKFDEIWMEFACELRATFVDYDATRDVVHFLDREKQSIVHSLLTNDENVGGAGLNEFCPLKAKHVLTMFPLHKHEELVALRSQWVTYWRESSTSCGVKRLVTHALETPVDAVAQYYGERIAYYFAWLELYTRWLVAPSVAGVILFVLQVHAKTLDHPLASVYAIGMALWTAAFLLAWKRRAAALAYKWGTLGYEEEERPRPEFIGDPALSTPTVKVYPAWKRYLKYGITVLFVIASMGAVLILTFYAFMTRDRLEAQSIAVKAKATNLAKDIARDLEHGLTLANWKRLTALGMDWDFWIYFLVTPLLYGLLIPGLDYAFTILARWLTTWENHATESRDQSHLILKVFSFRFVHVFASLYYYAFNSPVGGNSLLRLAVQLASFMVSDQLWRNAMQTLYPFVMRRFHAQRKKTATNVQFHQSTVFNSLAPDHRRSTRAPAGVASNARIHEQCVRLEQASDRAWEEADLEPYDTFEDYTEMLIQFGYVTFFSLAFPLAPLLALINNIVEMRMDAFKLCHAKQRPIAHKASGIGVWFSVLQLMSVLAVLTNCLHIAFTTTLVERLVPHVTSAHKVWVVFGVEHLILALQVWMNMVIPSMPSDVQAHVRKEREHAKVESARAMAAKIQSQQLTVMEAEPPTSLMDDPTKDSSGVRRRSSANRGDQGVRAAEVVTN